jgi:hypothetical protein
MTRIYISEHGSDKTEEGSQGTLRETAHTNNQVTLLTH